MPVLAGEGTSRMWRNVIIGILGIGLQLLGGCDSQLSSTPETAEGETHIRYVICGTGGYGCFVAARFKDIDSCERHKRWSEMLCDTQSERGKMICTQDTSTQVSSSYCTL